VTILRIATSLTVAGRPRAALCTPACLIATRQGIDTPGGDVGEFSTITKGPIPVSGYFLVSGLIEDALTAFAFGWGHGAVAEWRAAFFGYACGHCGVALMRVDQSKPHSLLVHCTSCDSYNSTAS